MWRAALAALAVLAAAPGSAAAHAGFVSSTPPSEAVVDATPGQVVLRFNQPVTIDAGSVRVFDGVADRVALGTLAQPRPDTVAAPVPGRLARGSYTVAWRVISDDVDAVSGTFVFHVGPPRDAVAPPPADALAAGPEALLWGAQVTRAAAYVLLLLCAGGAATLGLALRGTAPARVRRILAWLALALACTSLLAVALTGAAASVGLGELLGSRFGAFTLGQCVTALALALALSGARAARPALPWLGALLLVGHVLAERTAGEGAGPVVGELARTLAAAMWSGGLSFLLLAGREQRSVAAAGTRRFAGLAAGAAAALLITLAAGLSDPPASRAARAAPFRATVALGSLEGRLTVAPGRAGWNRIELSLPLPTPAQGGWFDARVHASLAAAGVRSLRFAAVQDARPGRFSVGRAYLPHPGTWTLEVAVRRGAAGRYAATVTMPVPPA